MQIDNPVERAASNKARINPQSTTIKNTSENIYFHSPVSLHAVVHLETGLAIKSNTAYSWGRLESLHTVGSCSHHVNNSLD